MTGAFAKRSLSLLSQLRAAMSPEFLGDLAALTKMRLVALSLFSAAAGFYLADSRPFSPWELLYVLASLSLVAGGSQALNQWMEKDADRRMIRTQNRPIPAGRIPAEQALVIGAGFFTAGMILLIVGTNGAAVLLAAVTVILYLGLYTPLKLLTPWCTLVGAVPGALPPLIGWAARTGSLSFPAWTIFFIIFLWQVPHFYAISWIHREDYARAGFVIRPVVQQDGRLVAKEALVYLYLLLPASILPWLAGVTGIVYAAAAAAGSFLLAGAGRLCAEDMDRHARTLFWGSILYLTVILIFMIGDKT